MMARKRAEKKKTMEIELADLQSLQSLIDNNDSQQFKEEIQARHFASLESYQKRIKFLSVKLGIATEADEKTPTDKFALLDIADEFLKPDQLKQKRILKMHKTASLMREKRKKQQEEEKKRVDELKTTNKEQYLQTLYDRRQIILERIQDRVKQKEEIAKRGSKTAQRRMQMIAELGADEGKRHTRGQGVP